VQPKARKGIKNVHNTVGKLWVSDEMKVPFKLENPATQREQLKFYAKEQLAVCPHLSGRWLQAEPFANAILHFP
jgi:hypothetical protein